MTPLPEEQAPRWRPTAGAFLIIAIITGWAIVVASLAHWVGRWPGAVQAIFYLLAGIIWIVPLIAFALLPDRKGPVPRRRPA